MNERSKHITDFSSSSCIRYFAADSRLPEALLPFPSQVRRPEMYVPTVWHFPDIVISLVKFLVADAVSNVTYEHFARNFGAMFHQFCLNPSHILTNLNLYTICTKCL